MFHGLNLCHAVRIPHKRQVCVQHFHIRTDGVLGLIHDSFQDFLVTALNLLSQTRKAYAQERQKTSVRDILKKLPETTSLKISAKSKALER